MSPTRSSKKLLRDQFFMAISPDTRPLPPLPREPPSRLLRIPNSSIILTLPTISSTIYSTVTANFIKSYMQSKPSKHPTEPSKNYKNDKNSTCLINSSLPYKKDSMDGSHPWSYNNEGRSIDRPLPLTRWTDPIHEIIDLYNH